MKKLMDITVERRCKMHDLSSLLFKKDSFNYQSYVCNKCHYFSMTVMYLSDFFILNIKNNVYRVYISNIDKKEAIIIFKKSNLDDKGVL